MKRYVLLIAAMVGLAAGCQAASPSFSSFYTNHFLTNGLVIKANLNPTQFDTNSSSITITITNVSGISGGSHWTNPVGVLKPRSGQTTNVLTFVSGSADNATNTALVVGTVNAWTDANAKLLTLRDVGTDVFYVTPHGSVEIGRSIAPWWLPDEGDILAGVHDVSQGDSDRSVLHIAAVDDAVTTVNFASHTVTLQSGVNAQVASTTKAEVGGVDSRITVALVPDQGTADFEIINTGETTFKVNSDAGVYARDTLYSGPNSMSLFGDTELGFVQYRSVNDSDDDEGGVAIYTQMTAGQAIGTFDVSVKTNLTHLAVGWNDGPSAGRGVNITVSPSDTQLDMSDLNGTTRVLFQSSETSSTSSSISHFVDTDTTWTQGTLFGVRNNSTNAFSVGNQAQLTFGTHSRPIYNNASSVVAAHQLQQGGTNSCTVPAMPLLHVSCFPNRPANF